MVVTDSEGRIAALNPAAERLFGVPRDEALGRVAAELIAHPDDREALRAASGTLALRGRRAGGRAFPLEAVVAPLDERHRVLHLRDATADVALAQRQSVAAALGDPVIQTDSDFRVTAWNPAAERVYGWTAREAVGRTVPDLLRTELTAEERAELVRELAREGHVLRLVTQYRRDGTPVEVEASVIAYDGGLITINRDVTARRALEARLRESRDLEMVGRLAGGVAHDLNTLLTAMLGYADLTLADGELPARVRPDVEEIRRATERAGDLTRQLQAFGRRQVLAPRVVDVNEIVRRTLDTRRRLAGRGVEVTDRLAPGLPPVEVDPGQLERVVLDVVANAGEATERGGRVTLETACVEPAGEDGVPPGVYVRIEVTDTGAGMDAATRSRAFEPFFTTKPGHSGLGLATVYGIVRQSGGHVTIDAEPRAGTSVAVYLPRVSG